jgi:multiple sugar transport system substrate-binding protein
MDSVKTVVEEGVRRFERANPGDKAKVTYHVKKDLNLALRSAFQAGQGPDIFFMDSDTPEFIDFAADLSTGINWANVLPGAKQYWTRPGRGGKIGVWALDLALDTVELYYNKAHFVRLGITVPPTNQFDEGAFTDVVRRCVEAGLAAFAVGIADRSWSGTYIMDQLLLSKLGEADLRDLWTGGGRVTWNNPRVQEVLTYHKKLVDMKAYPANVSSIKIGEAHRYFYGEQKACMMPIASWYTFRAFQPPEQGGQPNDFQLGMLLYTGVKNGKGHNEKFAQYSASLSVYSKSRHLAKAKAFVNTFAHPDIGALWISNLATLTGIKTDVSKVTGDHVDYFKMFLGVNRRVKLVPMDWLADMKPGMREAYSQVMSSAFPAGLISVAEATKILEKARASGR